MITVGKPLERGPSPAASAADRIASVLLADPACSTRTEVELRNATAIYLRQAIAELAEALAALACGLTLSSTVKVSAAARVASDYARHAIAISDELRLRWIQDLARDLRGPADTAVPACSAATSHPEPDGDGP